MSLTQAMQRQCRQSVGPAFQFKVRENGHLGQQQFPCPVKRTAALGGLCKICSWLIDAGGNACKFCSHANITGFSLAEKARRPRRELFADAVVFDLILKGAKADPKQFGRTLAM